MALPAPPTDGAPAVATLSLISRLGWKRAGTRFNTRGVDDDGNTANFVEVRPLEFFQQSLLILVFRQKRSLVRTSIVSVTYKYVEVFLVSDYSCLKAMNLIGVSQFSGNSKVCRLLVSVSRLLDPMLPNLRSNGISSNLWRSTVQYMLLIFSDKKKTKPLWQTLMHVIFKLLVRLLETNLG